MYLFLGIVCFIIEAIFYAAKGDETAIGCLAAIVMFVLFLMIAGAICA